MRIEEMSEDAVIACMAVMRAGERVEPSVTEQLDRAKDIAASALWEGAAYVNGITDAVAAYARGASAREMAEILQAAIADSEERAIPWGEVVELVAEEVGP